MTKRSIPINDKKWDVSGQFAEVKPVYEIPGVLLRKQLLARQKIDDSDQCATKAMERKRVEKIDDFMADGIDVNKESDLRSVYFHWWDKDNDPYFYWDLK